MSIKNEFEIFHSGRETNRKPRRALLLGFPKKSPKISSCLDFRERRTGNECRASQLEGSSTIFSILRELLFFSGKLFSRRNAGESSGRPVGNGGRSPATKEDEPPGVPCRGRRSPSARRRLASCGGRFFPWNRAGEEEKRALRRGTILERARPRRKEEAARGPRAREAPCSAGPISSACPPVASRWRSPSSGTPRRHPRRRVGIPFAQRHSLRDRE